jgi:hypothetical protein
MLYLPHLVSAHKAAVIKCYRNLLKTQRFVFKGDIKTQIAAWKKTKEEFQKNKEANPEKVFIDIN